MFLDPLAQFSVWIQSVLGPAGMEAMNQIGAFLNHLAGI